MKYAVYILLSTLPFSSAFSYEIDSLNVYLWEDTISPNVISDWEAETEQKINLIQFDNDDERNLLMLESGQLPFDIMLLDNISAQTAATQNKFEDLSSLSNRKYNDSRWNSICGNHAIPYFWGTVGILYRSSKVDQIPHRWSDLIQPVEKYHGHIGIIKDSIETLMPALYSLGYSPLTSNIEELKQAYELMTEFNRNILTYEYSLSYVRSRQDSAKLYMALGYSGDQYSLNRFFHTNEWNFVTPDGAPFIWVDCMAVNGNSQNKELAKAFLNYLMLPHIAAKNALYVGSSTVNTKALELLPDHYRNDRGLFLEKERFNHAILDQELTPENLNIRAKIINNLFSQYEAQP